MGTEITNYEKAWADRAQAERDRMPAQDSGKTITTSGGIFKIGEDAIEGNALVAVILDSIFENAFYEGEWNPNNTVPPHCFAMSHDEAALAPHPSMGLHEHFKAQSSACKGCPQNEFGSAAVGKGKACKNRVRLALIPAGFMEPVKGVKGAFAPELIEDEAHYRDAAINFLKVPPTSIKAYRKYVKTCSEQYGRPPYGLITRIDSAPMQSGGFELTFEALEAFPNEFFNTLTARHEQAKAEIERPYSPPDDEATQRAVAKPAAGVSRLKALKR